MSPGRFVTCEAWNEFQGTMRGPLVPLVATGLVGYVAIVVLSAEYMRNMGAADVARNSPHVVYLMATGQGILFLFAWAWIFARTVARDRDARLHEIVLATPTSLPQLFVGRYFGALGVSSLLGLVGVLGFIIVHPLQAIGALPASAVGPTPWGAIFWAWLLLIVPSAMGTGALYLVAALRTRNATGPFSVAAGVAVVWMVAMVIIRGGDVDAALATVIDPTGFSEVKEQTDAWTPAEKMNNLLVLSVPLFWNRLVWGVAPMLFLGLVLARLNREGLVLERARNAKPTTAEQAETDHVRSPRPELPDPVRTPSWLWATLLEARWHLKQSVGSWGVVLTLILFCLGSVLGSFVNVVGHADGPLVPRPELLIPLLSEFMYLATAFIIAGFVGVVMRRDEELGYVELAGAAPAPLGVRLVGRVLGAVGLVGTLMVPPIVSSYVVTGLAAPHSFSLFNAPAFFLLVYAPGLLELCAITIVLHAVVRKAGIAYTLSMLMTFIFIVNNELGIVTYPVSAVGIPARVTLSELVGWRPWWPLILAQGIYKVGFLVVAVGVAWLAWPRGMIDRWTERLRTARLRLRGGALATLGTGIAIMIGSGAVIHDRIVIQGDYEDPKDERAMQAEWERQWVSKASAFEVEGGEVVASVDPSSRTASARWTLRGVRVSQELLLGELPNGVTITKATVQGKPVAVETRWQTFGLAVTGCPATGCEVVLELKAIRWGWPVEGHTPWVHPSQVWLTARDLLPRLGLDAHRSLRSLTVRATQGLDVALPRLPLGAGVSASGVAPWGRWRWSVQLPNGWHLPNRGQVDGPLDFALAWRPKAPERTHRDGVTVWHGPGHRETANEILDDLKVMQSCVEHRIPGATAKTKTVLQAPREGESSIRGQVLWLPEDQGWDVTTDGYGRWNRRRSIAAMLAAEGLVRQARLHQQPGARWLVEGVAGATALDCVRKHDGDRAWLAVVERDSDAVVEELGVLDAPIAGLAADGDAEWIEPYSPLSTFAWASGLGQEGASRVVKSVLQAVRKGVSVPHALRDAAGREHAEQLLGAPLASDLALVVSANANKLAELGQRWRWSEGGWQKIEPTRQVLLLPHRAGEARGSVRRVAVPASIDAQAPFTLLDLWPSFERSIANNVWIPDPGL